MFLQPTNNCVSGFACSDTSDCSLTLRVISLNSDAQCSLIFLTEEGPSQNPALRNTVSSTGLRSEARQHFEAAVSSSSDTHLYDQFLQPRHLQCVFLLVLAVPLSWLGQLVFISSSWRHKVPNLSLRYRQVLCVTFCKKMQPFLPCSLSDLTSALFWPSREVCHWICLTC